MPVEKQRRGCITACVSSAPRQPIVARRPGGTVGTAGAAVQAVRNTQFPAWLGGRIPGVGNELERHCMVVHQKIRLAKRVILRPFAKCSLSALQSLSRSYILPENIEQLSIGLGCGPSVSPCGASQAVAQHRILWPGPGTRTGSREHQRILHTAQGPRGVARVAQEWAIVTAA